eukprot:1392513-Amorphochlora_amoeboformis.AAC.1
MPSGCLRIPTGTWLLRAPKPVFPVNGRPARPPRVKTGAGFSGDGGDCIVQCSTVTVEVWASYGAKGGDE